MLDDKRGMKQHAYWLPLLGNAVGNKQTQVGVQQRDESKATSR